MNKLFSLNDVLFISALSIVFVILIFFSPDKSVPNSFRVNSPGRSDLILPLDKDQNYIIKGALGATEIEVKEGKVRVLDSPCPNHICLKTGWIDKPGHSIICLPNKVAIEITGEDSDLDAKVY